MKKLRSLLIGICLIIGLLFLGTVWLERSTGMSDAKVLNIYNWGDYIDPKLITKQGIRSTMRRLIQTKRC